MVRTASGPVARDIIKAYYDKKTKKSDGQMTADGTQFDLGHSAPAAAAIQPQPILKQPVLKQEEQPQTVPARARTRD